MTMSDEELSDDRLIALLRDAEARDRLKPASAALSSRILADFHAVSARRWSMARFVDVVWPGAPVWKPAFALGLSLMVGLGVGALLPVTTAPGETTVALDASPGLDFGGELR
jgi:hypothetical protein